MSTINKEMQLQRNCRLYMYLLKSQGKEVPEEIQDCAEDYDYIINCTEQLTQAVNGLDSESYEKIVNNKDSSEAAELRHWLEMLKEADRLHKLLSSDV